MAAPISVEAHTAEINTDGYRIGDPRPSAPEPGYAGYSDAGYPGFPPPARPAVPTNIYRARRPGAAVLLIIPSVLVGLLFVRGLAIAAFGAHFDLGGVIASALALTSLPFLVAGVYGLMTGAAYGAEQFGFRVWARPPLAYLVVGLVLVTSAGLAVR